jgi:hypothetical protein
VYTSLENANSSAEKCTGLSPPYNTQGTCPALRKACVAFLPTLSLFDPLIVIDFIFII